jgi:hypothetical protein
MFRQIDSTHLQYPAMTGLYDPQVQPLQVLDNTSTQRIKVQISNKQWEMKKQTYDLKERLLEYSVRKIAWAPSHGKVVPVKLLFV